MRYRPQHHHGDNAPKAFALDYAYKLLFNSGGCHFGFAFRFFLYAEKRNKMDELNDEKCNRTGDKRTVNITVSLKVIHDTAHNKCKDHTRKE